MSSLGEWVGSFSPGLRELGRTGKAVFGDVADDARAAARSKAGEVVAQSREGQKIQKEYLVSRAKEWAPLIMVAVIGGIIVLFLKRV